MVPAQNMNLATPESLWSSATTFLERPKIAVVFRPSLECDQGLWESLGRPLTSLPFCILPGLVLRVSLLPKQQGSVIHFVVMIKTHAPQAPILLKK